MRASRPGHPSALRADAGADAARVLAASRSAGLAEPILDLRIGKATARAAWLDHDVCLFVCRGYAKATKCAAEATRAGWFTLFAAEAAWQDGSCFAAVAAAVRQMSET
jgi:hypothetical protein